MSAIITNQFRRNSRKLFLEDISASNSNDYFIGIGKSDPWPDLNSVSEDGSTYSVQLPANSIRESEDALQNLIGLLKIQEVFSVIPRNQWVTGRKYRTYDPTDINLFNYDSINGYYPSYVTHSDRIYVCLNNVSESSTSSESTAPPEPVEPKVPVTTGDGYTWAYVCDVSSVSNFYTDQFIDIPESTTHSLGDHANATGGIIYGFKIVNGGTDITPSDAVNIVGMKNGTSTQELLSGFKVNITGGVITSIVPEDGNSLWHNLYTQASLVVVGTVGQEADIIKETNIIPLIAPIGGFGAAPQSDLPSFYGGLFASYVGSMIDEIPVDLGFRQISLVKNPGVTASDATDTVIDTLRYMTVNDVSGIGGEKGTIITGGNGAKAYLDYIDGGNIYYHQNSNGEINQKGFTTGSVTITSPTGTVKNTDITALAEGEYEHGTGELIFLENRKQITRNVNQQEDVKLIIQF